MGSSGKGEVKLKVEVDVRFVDSRLITRPSRTCKTTATQTHSHGDRSGGKDGAVKESELGHVRADVERCPDEVGGELGVVESKSGLGVLTEGVSTVPLRR